MPCCLNTGLKKLQCPCLCLHFKTALKLRIMMQTTTSPTQSAANNSEQFYTNLEAGIIAALLYDTGAIASVGGYLNPHHFQNPLHKAIAGVIWKMFEAGTPIDVLLAEEKLRQTGYTPPGGYLSLMANMATNRLEHDAHLLIERSIQTDIINLATEVITRAGAATADAESILDFYANGIADITHKNTGSTSEFVGGILPQAMKVLKHGGNTIATLHHSLDTVLGGGVTPDDFIIIAARPATGKTAFALSLARNFSFPPHNLPVAVFSLEMSKAQLTNRMLAAQTGIELHCFTSGQITDAGWVRLVSSNNPLATAPLYIDDTPGITINQLHTRLRRMKAELGIGVAIIDYLQLIHPGELQKANTRQEAVAHISRRLKVMQKELGIPVIALSQLSRALETRSGDKRPQLSDLRESGAIEQDADMVWFLYRPELYGIEYDEDNIPTRGMIEVIVAKHRNGSTGTAKLSFNPENMRFNAY